MTAYEYTVIPAPDRGERAKGAKTASERFAIALTGELNRMGAEGWEYLRAEVLPTEERSGLTGRSTVYHNLLVFRRAVADEPVVSDFGPPPPGMLRPFTRPMRAPAPDDGSRARTEGSEGAGSTAADDAAAPKS